VSVVYISHRLGEIVRLADRAEVLRDGRNVASLVGEEINHDRMVEAMVGRDIDHLYSRRPIGWGDVRLEVQNVRVEEQAAPPVSLTLRAGEVVGIAGLVGSGRSELLEAIFGIRPLASGVVEVDGTRIRPGDPRAAIAAGLTLVPEDRKRTGLLIESDVRQNATLAAMADASPAPRLDPRWQKQMTADLIEQLSVKAASQETIIANLSGGNQQKIAVGKWLMCEPKVLMLDEPTRGVDVGAKQEIYSLLDRLAHQGLAVLFVSSEMEEVLALADRILVMHDGRVTGELVGDQRSEASIMRLAVGMSV
jgi:ribose transport system ATP-binding protein